MPGAFVSVVPYSTRRSDLRTDPIDGRKTPPKKAQREGNPDPDWSSPAASPYKTIGCRRKGRWTFASNDARELPSGVFPADSLFPVKMSKKVDRLSLLPSPPKWTARETPSSNQGFGLIAMRIPERIECGIGRFAPARGEQIVLEEPQERTTIPEDRA
jgi:hypothetical protein